MQGSGSSRPRRPSRSRSPRRPRTTGPTAYAREAVEWAVAEGLLRGDDTGNLRLHEPITRQDVVVLLYRVKSLA